MGIIFETYLYKNYSLSEIQIELPSHIFSGNTHPAVYVCVYVRWWWEGCKGVIQCNVTLCVNFGGNSSLTHFLDRNTFTGEKIR